MNGTHETQFLIPSQTLYPCPKMLLFTSKSPRHLARRLWCNPTLVLICKQIWSPSDLANPEALRRASQVDLSPFMVLHEPPFLISPATQASRHTAPRLPPHSNHRSLPASIIVVASGQICRFQFNDWPQTKIEEEERKDLGFEINVFVIIIF